MMSLLKCDDTNPIVIWLNANHFKSSETLYLWSFCIIDIYFSMVGIHFSGKWYKNNILQGIAYIVHEGVDGRDVSEFQSFLFA